MMNWEQVVDWSSRGGAGLLDWRRKAVEQSLSCRIHLRFPARNWDSSWSQFPTRNFERNSAIWQRAGSVWPRSGWICVGAELNSMVWRFYLRTWQLVFVSQPFMKGEDFEAAMFAILPDLNQAQEDRLNLGSMQLCWEACFRRKAAWGVVWNEVEPQK